MLDSAAHDHFVELARARLAAGSGADDVLGELRERGVHKIDCIRVIQEATGISHGDAKRLVHYSPVWSDRRAGDEYVEDLFWRVLFIDCLVGRGQVNEPDELAAEWRERQQQATAQLRNLAAGLPGEELTRYREFMAENLLAEVADTLCINELLGEDEPVADADDFVWAAHVVRRLTARPG